MKRVIQLFIGSFLFLSMLTPVYADSARAYQDYLYQFDVYRAKYNEFEVAKNEYQKFGTLTAQTTAIETTRNMLAQRDQLIRAYLLLLRERLLESPMDDSSRVRYQTLIDNEVQFLDNHSLLVESIGDLEDATEISEDLQDHYTILQRSIRQTIIALTIGDLESLGRAYDAALLQTRFLINRYSNTFTLEKQATVDRWVLQITNKRTLFQRQIDNTRAQNEALRGSLSSMNDQFIKMRSTLDRTEQELVEGTSFMQELANTLRFQD